MAVSADRDGAASQRIGKAGGCARRLPDVPIQQFALQCDQRRDERPQQLSENLRRYQVYNYELGLRAIEDVLSPEEKKGIPAAPNAFSSVGSFSEQMAITQNRLEQLQGRLQAREKRIQDAVDSANIINLWLYVALSLVSVAGAVCQIMAMKSESAAETGAKG